MTVEIREHVPGKDLKAFLEVPHVVYAGDPCWVSPLHVEVRDRLTPAKNPFFDHAEVALWTAWRDGRPVGRVSAQVDREHLRIHDDATGFFGLIDTIDEPEVARLLLERASDWCRRRGMKRIRGPFSLSINEECGLLVDGFETPPSVMMAHHRPYQGALVEKAGFHKAKDLFAWAYSAGSVPERARKGWEQIVSRPEVRLRPVDMKKLDSEIRMILDIFNDAWRNNWGFVPATEAEAKKMVADMRMVLDPELTVIAEVSGRPVGMVIALPNLNECIRDLHGKLFPFGLPKLMWRLKVKHPTSARLMLLGIHSDLRNDRRYAALSLALYVEINDRGRRAGYQDGELSWTLEDNHPVNIGIRVMGGRLYKRYRIYENEL